jgi:hypothetical protein
MSAPRWVACSQDADYAASRSRHLAYPGGLTTLCGATASEPAVWRGNTTKPQCRTCLRVAEEGLPAAAHTEAEEARVARIVADVEAGKVVSFTVPAPAVDWNARYKGYAYRQLVNTRDRMLADLTRDIEQGRKSGAELDRGAARLASYNDLITALESLKGLLK